MSSFFSFFPLACVTLPVDVVLLMVGLFFFTDFFNTFHQLLVFTMPLVQRTGDSDDDNDGLFDDDDDDPVDRASRDLVAERHAAELVQASGGAGGLGRSMVKNLISRMMARFGFVLCRSLYRSLHLCISHHH